MDSRRIEHVLRSGGCLHALYFLANFINVVMSEQPQQLHDGSTGADRSRAVQSA
jgi:hypothetical protein